MARELKILGGDNIDYITLYLLQKLDEKFYHAMVSMQYHGEKFEVLTDLKQEEMNEENFKKPTKINRSFAQNEIQTLTVKLNTASQKSKC